LIGLFDAGINSTPSGASNLSLTFHFLYYAISTLSGNILLNTFSKNGIVQINMSTPAILKIICEFATVLSTEAPELIYFTNSMNG
jgi:hypothetical protein